VSEWVGGGCIGSFSCSWGVFFFFFGTEFFLFPSLFCCVFLYFLLTCSSTTSHFVTLSLVACCLYPKSLAMRSG
jgi:hypothetical protein